MDRRPARRFKPSPARGVATATPSDFLVIGRVARPWGVFGDLKVVPLTDHPERFPALKEVYLAGRLVKIREAKLQVGMVRLTLAGVSTREAAEEFRGQFLEIPKSSAAVLPPGEYYHFQIVGLRVLDDAGQELGTVAEVLVTGANDVYIVRSDGPEILLPAIEEVVLGIDLADQTMTVHLIDGLIPEIPVKRVPRRPNRRRSKAIPEPDSLDNTPPNE